jgi:uridine kinase
MRPHIIGIAGPSSSGKTELAKRLAEALAGTPIVSLDSYYRDLPGLPLEERAQSNFDCPDALEWELLREHLRALAQGLPIDEPSYDFAHHARTSEARRIQPAEFVILEGLFVLHWPELRDLLETKVYVETSAGTCFCRRLARDVAERGRTPESVRRQYEATVLPGAERFVWPSKRYADLIVSGEQPLAVSTAAVLAAVRTRDSAAAPVLPCPAGV